MIIIIGVLIVIVFGLVRLYFPTTYNTNVTSGYVIEKNNEDMSLLIIILGNSNHFKKLKVIVRNENVFNLVEVERSYFLTYTWKNQDIPVLGQIEINDVFMEIYGEDIPIQLNQK